MRLGQGSPYTAAAAPTIRWYRAGTSVEICRAREAIFKPGRIKVEVARILPQHLHDGPRAFTRKSLIGFVFKQHIGRLSPVGDNHRPLLRRSLRFTGVLVELPAGHHLTHGFPLGL